RGLPVDEITGAIATGKALKRVLILDAASSGSTFGGTENGWSETGLRGTVERLSRAHGVHLLVATGATNRSGELPGLGPGALSYALLAAVGIDRGPLKDKAMDMTAGEVDTADWFQFAAGQAGSLLEKLTGPPQGVQNSTRAKSFPILVPKK